MVIDLYALAADLNAAGHQAIVRRASDGLDTHLVCGWWSVDAFGGAVFGRAFEPHDWDAGDIIRKHLVGSGIIQEAKDPAALERSGP